MGKKVVILVLLLFSILLNMIAKFNLSFAEFYALNVYPVFSETISFFTSKISFSLAEILIIGLIVLLLVYFTVTLVKTIIGKTFEHVKRFLLNIVYASTVIFLMFVLFCGINYYRYEFTHYSGLEIKKSSKEELINLCELLINDANEKRAKLNSKNNTAELFDANFYGTSQRAKLSIDKISERYLVLRGNFSAPKQVYFSNIMSEMRITGMFFPFTFESNVNIHIPPYEIPSTMVHELVHLRGFMREDEANFISYLACINSNFDDFYYSGTMLALTHSMNALYYEDYDSFKKLYETYSKDVLYDLQYSTNYWKQYETKVAEISNKVNDAYLKANNQKDGVKSYGRMVDLLLAYYRDPLTKAYNGI